MMWRCEDEHELGKFLGIVRRLPRVTPKVSRADRSRYISQEVREFVLEKDEGRCRAMVAGRRCPATTELHFDHVIPFIRGGANEPKNIRILCQEHNLEKGSGQRY